MIDQPVNVRQGEELNQAVLANYLREHVAGFKTIERIQQFPGGFSNLTYLVGTNLGEMVLRKPPHGANIKSAHDMQREYRVLERLKGIYGRIPPPIHFCADETIIGGQFYLMERVRGVILRSKPPKGFDTSPDYIRKVSEAAVDNLALLHQINIHTTGLDVLGKPEGYVGRQVDGWIKRYQKAQTDNIRVLDELATWMRANQLPDGYPGLIHNDYKYDNLVLDEKEPVRILAVLDWEMATVGDTRMDLGTSLAYWSEAKEAAQIPLAASNLTWLPGNLNRQEVVERYCNTTGHDLPDPKFYFVYGAFKIAVIVQQIYARWKKGLTQDPRFENLIHAVHYFGNLGRLAIDKDRISGLL
ncbi:MAG: phosphotransferase family protein [Bacteroidota bacterium]